MRIPFLLRANPCRSVLLVLLSVWVLRGTVLRAQVEDPPDGLPAGPWILLPALVAGYSSDSNVFYTPPELGAVSDRLLTASASLKATLPFRNSRVYLSYDATKDNYRTVELVRSLSQNFVAGGSLLFSSLDRLEVEVERELGAFNTQAFDPGGETVFRGQPFDFDQQTIGVSRRVPGRRGWDVNANRSVLDYTPDPVLALYDYDSLEVTALYREPISPTMWVVLDLTGRSSDQFEADATGPDREVTRKERSRMYRAGAQGSFGAAQTYQILAGLADFEFPDTSGSDYQGIVFDGRIEARFGVATFLDVFVSRRPWVSFFLDNNYYIGERVAASFERRWLRSSRIGVEGDFSRSSYGDPIPEGYFGEGIVRKDRTVRFQAYANLMFHDRFGVRLSVEDDRRTSNYEFGEYSRRVYFVGILVGWYE